VFLNLSPYVIFRNCSIADIFLKHNNKKHRGQNERLHFIFFDNGTFGIISNNLFPYMVLLTYSR